MRRVALVWGGAVALALLLAAWVTTAGLIQPLRGAENADEAPTTPDGPAATAAPRTGRTREIDDPADSAMSSEATVFMYALLVLLAVALALLIFRRVVMVVLRDRRRSRRAADVAETDDPSGLVLAGALAESVERGLAQLREGEPRDAIVRSWMILEDTVERVGLDRDPALTSEEFTAAVIGRFSVDVRSIEVHAALYREARFSVHALGESHRRRAVDALERVRNDLASITSATAVTSSRSPGVEGP